MVGSTAAGSISWSKVTTKIWSVRRCSPCGLNDSTVGGGVVNLKAASFASAWPLIDSVPAGTVTVKVDAIGNRSTESLAASKRRVRVPIHCQVPGSSGEMMTGTSCEFTWLTVPTGTIG